jgi:dolichol-phosphate mannosyltransferase
MKIMNNNNILVMLPTYNERENVEMMCQKIAALDIPIDILFIDDSSPDGTGTILKLLAEKNSQISVIERSGKLGIGSAHLDGILWAYSHMYSRLITMDCDFTHSPDNIRELLESSEDFDIVVGSRHILENSLNGWNLGRKVLTIFGHFLTTNLLKMPYDATGAFRLYRIDRISPAFFNLVSSRGYSFFCESLAILNLNNFRIREIPIALPPRTCGHSKMKVHDMIMWLIVMMQISWNIRFKKQKYFLEKMNNF